MSPRNYFHAANSLLRRAVNLVPVFALSMAIFAGSAMADKLETAKLVSSDGAYADAFGSSVSISGDYAIVGAPNDDEASVINSGCAYIFKREAGSWVQKDKLLAPDRSNNDLFGFAVSISGDYAIVGKPFDDHTGTNYGSAYIYHRVGENWIQAAKLVALAGENASDGGPNDYFGNAVAIHGDYAIVGAPFDDDNGADSGSAYIYHRVGEGWSQVAKLLAPDGAAGDLFGYSVAITSDNAVVGAPRRDTSGNADRGAMYIFSRSGESWTTLGVSTDPAGAAGDEFGGSVAIDGNFALGGAQKYDADGGLTDAGSARLYENIGLWATFEHHILVPSERAASDYFGYSVSMSGDQVVVGSLKYQNSTGTVYLFQKSAADDSWPQIEKLIASDGPWGFGSAVAVSGQFVIVGAKQAEAAYIYEKSVSSNDFNGDRNADILWRNTSTGENYVWYLDGVTVLGGGVLPTVSVQDWKIVGVADFNNDGKPDILWRNISTGENYIWYLDGVTVMGGGSLPMVSGQSWKIVGVEDFNNDNKPDILWRNVSTGENYLWYLNGTEVTAGGALPMEPDQHWTIVGVADFNNDGKPDILWHNTSTGDNYVWHLDGVTVLGGGSLPPVADQNWTIVGVADFNTDGKPDILWRNTSTGENYIWYLDGVTVLGGGSLPPVADQTWTIVP